MKIVLSGVETNNKGAELMLYAILQEIERKYPKAEVYISSFQIRQGMDYLKTPLKLHTFPYEWLVGKTHINSILWRMGLPIVECMNFVKGDFFFDGSGFLFSDQCDLWGTTPAWWRRVLKAQRKNDAKIVFLPQAFGPIEKEKTKQALKVLSDYATIVMPREKVSYDYLKNSGIMNMNKVRKFADFTSLVEGVFPKAFMHLKGGICIIPNMKMIEKGRIRYDDYIKLLTAIATEGERSGKPVYLLNHEGSKDAELCLRCKESIENNIEAVTNLNALEVKGLISSAYMVITSRFHGLASALNSGVPSLATSWSHKYEELFKDYGLEGFILPLDNNNIAIERFKELLADDENKRVRNILVSKEDAIKAQTREMWKMIWSL